MVGIVKRVWIPLLILVVVAVGGVVVYRMHGIFGSDNEITRSGAGLAQDAEPFNPKVVTYEVTGTEGAVATINYLDLDATPQRVDDAPLPWSITLRTTKPSASATIIAQATPAPSVAASSSMTRSKTNRRRPGSTPRPPAW